MLQRLGEERSLDARPHIYAFPQQFASLRQNIIFSQHNLVTDRSFNEFNVILCRNVLIYFNQTLQNRVHDLFYESLCKFGVLGLGHKETINCTPHENHYDVLEEGEKLYRRIT